MTGPPVRLLVVAGLLVVGTAVGSALPAPAGLGTAARPAPAVPVVGAQLVCPDVRQLPGATSTGVAVGSAPAAGSAPGEGVLSVREVTPDAAATTLPSTTGQPRTGLGLEVADGALALRADGVPAAGLTAVQSTETVAGAERGLALLACPPVRTDGWLLGGAAGAGQSGVLVLVNPDPVPAVVDLTVLSAEGPTEPRAGRGLQVPPSGRTLVPLDTLAPGRTALAVRVLAGRGRVAAGLRLVRADGAVPGGLAWAAPSPGPAGQVVVPALPAGPGPRAVLVANPGEADVVVQVELTTGDGQFVPEGLAEVVVPARSTVPVDLSSPLAATPAAVRVTATGGPVLAAGVVEDVGQSPTAPDPATPAGSAVRDVAYLASAPALSGPALLPEVPVDGDTSNVVLLAALDGDAVVDLSVRPVEGGPAVEVERRVEVPGGRAVPVDVGQLLPPGLRGAVSVVVRADAGAPVHASVVRRASPPEGPLLGALSLQGSRPALQRPRVVRDPAVGAG